MVGKKKNHVLLWSLISQSDDLMSQVLCGKYGRGDDLTLHITSHSYDSPLWKAISYVSENAWSNMYTVIGDDRSTNFWLDKWITGEHAIIDYEKEFPMNISCGIVDRLLVFG